MGYAPSLDLAKGIVFTEMESQRLSITVICCNGHDSVGAGGLLPKAHVTAALRGEASPAASAGDRPPENGRKEPRNGDCPRGLDVGGDCDHESGAPHRRI
jgi:hypothetical protein